MENIGLNYRLFRRYCPQSFGRNPGISLFYPIFLACSHQQSAEMLMLTQTSTSAVSYTYTCIKTPIIDVYGNWHIKHVPSPTHASQFPPFARIISLLLILRMMKLATLTYYDLSLLINLLEQKSTWYTEESSIVIALFYICHSVGAHSDTWQAWGK